MVVYSPTDELFDPRLWESWAMVLSVVAMGGLGYFVARREDRDRTRRRQQRLQRRQQPSQRSPQRAVSYQVQDALPSPQRRQF